MFTEEDERRLCLAVGQGPEQLDFVAAFPGCAVAMTILLWAEATALEVLMEERATVAAEPLRAWAAEASRSQLMAARGLLAYEGEISSAGDSSLHRWRKGALRAARSLLENWTRDRGEEASFLEEELSETTKRAREAASRDLKEGKFPFHRDPVRLQSIFSGIAWERFGDSKFRELVERLNLESNLPDGWSETH